MLEFDDIQHLLLTRAPALKARYEFLSFRDGAGAAPGYRQSRRRFIRRRRCAPAPIRTSAG